MDQLLETINLLGTFKLTIFGNRLGIFYREKGSHYMTRVAMFSLLKERLNYRINITKFTSKKFSKTEIVT